MRFWLMVLWAISLWALPLRADTITVSAAISLKESLGDIRKAYEAGGGDKITFNFDASGKLAAQIEQGAPVDLFISADQAQMDKLQQSSHIDNASRRVIAENQLVLIANANEKEPPEEFSKLADGSNRKIAIGEPKTVPAGRYAMQTLKSLQLDAKLKDRLVYGQSVREVLAFVERDEVVAGIVYTTDAKEAGDKVKVIATAGPSSHDAIEYPAAIVSGSAHAEAAKRFLEYLSSEPAKKILKDRGFEIPASPTTRATP